MYRNADGRVFWAQDNQGKLTGEAILMNGQFYLYGYGGNEVWNLQPRNAGFEWPVSGDDARDDRLSYADRLVMQEDGNLVLYNANDNDLFASATAVAMVAAPAARDRLAPGQGLYATESITSSNGLYEFVHHSDGRLVLRRTVDGKEYWSQGDAGILSGAIELQADGELRQTAPGGGEAWRTGPGSVLIMQDDANLVLYDAQWSAVWAPMTQLIGYGYRP